ncbi:hypothetical protein ACRALDRAFT_2125325 [Sodiomyces alcalophilus JCM 7366]|uniref:uncharacterized protein n=1 Tax=Sodiomyces alcalophilus JCM 7366 TaxID=591952 RepID=UPI0039B50640
MGMVGVVNPLANQTLESYAQNAVGKPVFVPFPVIAFGGEFGEASAEDRDMRVEDPEMPSPLPLSDDESKGDTDSDGDGDSGGDGDGDGTREQDRSRAGTVRASLAGLVCALGFTLLLL